MLQVRSAHIAHMSFVQVYLKNKLPEVELIGYMLCAFVNLLHATILPLLEAVPRMD
jgi:hypothetical protein